MHYRLHLPEEHKFKIAVFVYVVISALEGTYLYLPLALMRLFCFLQGVLGVTSYNIRISSTQSYVPDDRKGQVQRHLPDADHQWAPCWGSYWPVCSQK